MTTTKIIHADPYPGLASFADQDEDRERFYGRQKEKVRLLQTVLSENLTVLYGKSGVGKTSLINAGLLDSLRKRNYFPIVLRLLGREGDRIRDIIEQIELQADTSNIQVQRDERRYQSQGDDLWHYLSTATFLKETEPLSPILIFDHFEELFTMDEWTSTDAIPSFLAQLVELIRGALPQRRATDLAAVVEKLDDNDAFRNTLIEELYGYDGPNVKTLISVREEYLPELDQLHQSLPNVLQNALRLMPLTVAQARDAITEPARNEKVVGKDTFVFQEDALDELLRFLRTTKKDGRVVEGEVVEPVHLQIICRQLNERRKRKNARRITTADIGGRRGMEKIIVQYYLGIKRQFPRIRLGWNGQKLHPSTSNFVAVNFPRIAVSNLCETGLITRGMYRNSVIVDDCERRFGVPARDLRRLQNERILRGDLRLGNTFYELIHDALIEPLRAYRQRRLSNRLILTMGGGIIFVGLAASFGLLVEQYENRRDYHIAGDDAQMVDERVAAFQALLDGSERRLSKLNLDGLDLSGTRIVGKDLSMSSLRKIALDFGAVVESNFVGADLEAASLNSVAVILSDFAGAKLSEVDFDGAFIRDSGFQKANLVGASLQRARLFEVDLTSADLRGAKMRGARFNGVNLEGADFSETEWWLSYGLGRREVLEELNSRFPYRGFANTDTYRKEIEKLRNVIEQEEGYGERSDRLNNLAWYRAIRGGNLDDAIEEISEALELRRSLHALDTKGYILLLGGSNEEAVEYFREANGNESNGERMYHLGLALERVGERNEAEEFFEKSKEEGYWPSYELVLTPPLASDNYGWCAFAEECP